MIIVIGGRRIVFQCDENIPLQPAEGYIIHTDYMQASVNVDVLDVNSDMHERYRLTYNTGLGLSLTRVP